MGNFILEWIDRTNAFILTFMDKIIAITHEIVTGGRKLTATVCASVCFTIIAIESIIVLKELSNVLIYVMGGCIMAFFGFNVWSYFSPNLGVKNGGVQSTSDDKTDSK